LDLLLGDKWKIPSVHFLFIWGEKMERVSPSSPSAPDPLAFPKPPHDIDILLNDE
jgi:hypothetical protein